MSEWVGEGKGTRDAKHLESLCVKNDIWITD